MVIIMIKIGRSYFFESAHHLPNYNGKCAEVHGHSYRLDIVLSPTEEALNNGMVIDFHEMDDRMKPFMKKYDHKDLNKIFENPTAELMAEAMYYEILTLFKEYVVILVRLWESANSYAEVCP